MGTKRTIRMSLSDSDEDMIREAELETYRGVSQRLEVEVLGSGTIDPFTKVLVPASPVWVVVSGYMVQIQEEDVLLGMGGNVSVGDWKISFPWPEVEDYYEDAERFRNPETGEEFEVEVKMATGLGPTRNRAEFALKQTGV